MSPVWQDSDPRSANGDLDPAAIAHDIDVHGTAWAHERHAAESLEKTTRAVLAELTNNVRRENPDLSRKESEDIALGSEQYRTHLYACADANRAANLARVKYEAARARFEAIRTLEATKRAEMQTLSRR
jgi:hypothetical protein